MAGESALYKKFRAEQDAADAAYKSWEKDQWEKNDAEWTKQGYTRTEDPSNPWGSKWSYKPTGNSSASNGGSSGGNGGSGSGSGSGSAVKVEDYSDLASSIQTTINNAQNLPSYTVGSDLFGTNNKNPLSTGLSGLTTGNPQTEEEKAETPFAYRKGKDTYYAKNNAYIDFMNIYKEATGNNFRTADPEHNKAFDSWISHYYNDNGFDLFGNKYTLRSVAEEQAAQEAQRKAKLAERAKSGATSQGYSLAAAMNTAFKNKQGGTMNKVKYFSQGGAPTQTTQNQMSPEQELKAAVKFLQDVQAGNERAITSLQQIQAAAKKGVPEAQRMMELLAQASKMMKSAKWGSKLEYIRSLKFAKGGKSCPVCEQQKVEMKKCGGKKAKKHYFGGYL